MAKFYIFQASPNYAESTMKIFFVREQSFYDTGSYFSMNLTTNSNNLFYLDYIEIRSFVRVIIVYK